MSPGIPWFDRKFAFATPPELHADVVDRLRGTASRVEEKLASLPAAVVTIRHNDEWSILENVAHLEDLEPLWSGRLDDILQGVATLRPADLTNRATHEADHNSRTPDEVAAAFRQARAQLVARLEALQAEDFARTALHPRLKQPMRLMDLCLFVAAHDDAHLARVHELGVILG